MVGLRQCIMRGAFVASLPAGLAAQARSATYDVSAGYSWLYHAAGLDVQIGLMKPIGAGVEQGVGAFLRFTTSELSSVLIVHDQRHLAGVGVRYRVTAQPAASVSPFAGASIQVLHSTTTDNPFLVGNPGPLPPPNPEDHVGHKSTGPAGAAEGGVAFRLSGSVHAIVRGSLEYQWLYTNPSTHTVWGVAAGVAVAIR